MTTPLDWDDVFDAAKDDATELREDIEAVAEAIHQGGLEVADKFEEVYDLSDTRDDDKA